MVKNGDSIIFYNYRGDRPRELEHLSRFAYAERGRDGLALVVELVDGSRVELHEQISGLDRTSPDRDDRGLAPSARA